MKDISANKSLEKNLNNLYIFFKKNNINRFANYTKKELLNLKKLDLSCCKLNNIPNEISILKNLEILDICNNNIKEIPESIFNLNNLKYIDISFNKIKYLSDKI